MKNKRLNECNMDVVVEAIEQIWDRRIERFDTQSLLHVFLENIKFPYLRGRRKLQTIHYAEYQEGPSPYDRKPYYFPNNYEPIIRWFMHNGILTKRQCIGKSNVIVYEVDRERIMQIPYFKNTYKI